LCPLRGKALARHPGRYVVPCGAALRRSATTNCPANILGVVRGLEEAPGAVMPANPRRGFIK
jgi:hypothetical protein